MVLAFGDIAIQQSSQTPEPDRTSKLCLRLSLLQWTYLLCLCSRCLLWRDAWTACLHTLDENLVVVTLSMPHLKLPFHGLQLLHLAAKTRLRHSAANDLVITSSSTHRGLWTRNNFSHCFLLHFCQTLLQDAACLRIWSPFGF